MISRGSVALELREEGSSKRASIIVTRSRREPPQPSRDCTRNPRNKISRSTSCHLGKIRAVLTQEAAASVVLQERLLW